MSDKILKALMQLFAILANAERFTIEGRKIVESFLQQQISQAHIQTYLKIFDEYLEVLQGKAVEGKAKKRVSVNSVKILRICTDINKELDTKQKHIVFIRLIEFVYSSDDAITELEAEFLATVADVFHILQNDVNLCVSLVVNKTSSAVIDSPMFLVINADPQNKSHQAKHSINETLQGDLRILNIKAAGILFVRYFGTDKLTLNGLPLTSQTCAVLSPGSVIRGNKVNAIYYSDIIRCFLDDTQQAELNLSVEQVSYVFKNGKIGLHDISFSATSGNLIGVMGGSGAGKSTLLNILNGNNIPSQGQILVNGLNLHTDKKKLEGVIGYVPQDDLLIEDLNVFQNLYLNSKLCFGNLSNDEIAEKVNQLLQVVGLYEAANLKVGDALHASISGGQRKRLNIALELIRAPQILFVDEPTSGLSSFDSENVMDLLKQLSISGKLVFVVIHQPSSDIFKMFDQLLILDKGGYPVYYGNPVDSLIYFKRHARYADADESECGICGNINPEQVFSIIESKVMDEFGHPTAERKLSPLDWNNNFRLENNFDKGKIAGSKEIPPGIYNKPSAIKQLKVFIQRDVLSKLNNRQYLLINFLEAPVLAFILAYFLKYATIGEPYIFRENKNLAAFIFMGVIVALFMGLTVSAEEIIRDRKILKREKFLNLSKSSYLMSKVIVMFLISAVQTFSFVIIGNLIFGIRDMYGDYWLVLFSVSCFANMLGLNVSSSFNSVVTIYILIPFLIIPQIILSGVMVKFEDLNPVVTSQTKVPLIGEIMASRWAFEALAVNQFKNNAYEKHFFEVDKTMSNATYKKDFWLQMLNDKLDNVYTKKNSLRIDNDLALLKFELDKEAKVNLNFKTGALPLQAGMTENTYVSIKNSLEELRKQYIKEFNIADEEKNKKVKQLTQRIGSNNLRKLKDNYTNESLNDLVLNKNDFTLIAECNNELIQRFRPVFMSGDYYSQVRAPFYVSEKNVFGTYYSTWSVNLFILWSMSVALMITLYFNAFSALLQFFNSWFERLGNKFRR
jgi:ABC-type multidrug transport system ATPase subunit/uncharacterized tellurite resistance protein B-like protein